MSNLDNNLTNKYNKAKSKVKAYKTTSEAKQKEFNNFRENAGDNFDASYAKTFKNLNEWGDSVDGQLAQKKKQSQDKIKNQLDELLEVFMIVKDSNESTLDVQGDPTLDKKKGPLGAAKTQTVDTLIDIYNKTILNTRGRIVELWVKETIKTVGCTEEQEFTVSPIYIRVESLDLFQMLKTDPNGDGELKYEKNDTNNGTIPYSMNRQMWDRLQNLGMSFNTDYGADYIGASNNQSFDIEYVDQDNNGNFGNYFKVTPKPGTGISSITQFLYDYYLSIEMINIDEFITNLIDLLTGAISFDLSITDDQSREQSKFLKLLQRTLGLCFDNQQEIDVSGVAKLSVIDNIDDTFFEFTSADLKDIEERVNNITNGVVEFTDCNNVKLPLQITDIKDALNKNRDIPGDSDKLDNIISMIDEMGDTEAWKLLLPQINFNASMKFDLLKLFPMAVMQTLLSPKNLFGLFVAFKMVGNYIIDQIESLTEFLQRFRSFVIEVMSKIGAIFVEELFKEIKKNIDKLVKQLLEDIAFEAKDARLRMIAGLIRGLILVGEFINDWRRCKSVVDELLDALKIASRALGLPQFSLALAGGLPGMSKTRMLANVLQEMEKAGLPTGDLPDGSPNLMVQDKKSGIGGMLDEMQENGKVEIYIPPLAISPAGVTLPSKGVGKSY
jgi:hypothetical protein